MSKIKINNIQLNGSELFNDSENFLSELKDAEMDEIIGGLNVEITGGLTVQSLDNDSIKIELIESDRKGYITTVYIPKEPICYPIKPIKPICWYPQPIHDEKPYPIEIFYNPCPVIL
jgi:hypothetical protein